MGKSLVLNGVDITRLITPWGYTVSHRKIQGGSQGTMLDGSFTDDVLAYKATVSATCMPLTDAQLNTLTANLMSQEYAYLRFYDPRTGDYRAAQCVYTPYEAKERGKGSDGNIYWTGMALKFEER